MDERNASDPEPLREGEESPPPGVKAAAIVRWAIVAAVGLTAAGTVGGVWLARAGDAQAATRYHCPMHPQIVQDRPGECPICGMTLVPIAEAPATATAPTSPATSAAPPPDAGPSSRTEGSHRVSVPRARRPGGTAEPPPPTAPPATLHGLAPVNLSLDRLQTSGIRTARAVHKALSPEIRAFGLVAADERRQGLVTARVPGWLRAKTFVAVGDGVRRGQVLASVESPEVLAATRELVAVRALSGGAGLGANELGAPVRQRLEILGLPRGSIDQVERSGSPLARVPVTAPIAGIVTARDVLPGTWVERGSPILSLADLSTVWVLAEIYARDLPRIAIGARAEVRVEAGAAPVALGTVAALYPTTDASTRTTRVRVELANPDLRIRPGLFADVAISSAPSEGVVVPVEAVIATGDRQYVFVAKGGGRFEPRLVRTGPRAEDEVLVTEGIAEGEAVVTSGNFLLDSESRLRAAVEGPLAGMGM